MRRIDLRRYCYVFLWLGLLLSVGAAWFFGGAALKHEKNSPQPEPSATPAPSPSPQPAAETKELAGVWVPYMALDTDEHTPEAFRENFKSIAAAAKEKGLNALFVHVRPFCDALYPSAYFPWSHILTGEQGEDPGFDPLEFMVEHTHSLGMEFHAWVNPLRVKTAETPQNLAEDNPCLVLGEDCPYYFMEWEGGVYLDPAYPYVRTLIAKGAEEIVKNYRVDGVHFDDYFYPTAEAGPDEEAYELYVRSVEEPLSLLEWRRANISALVQEVYAAVKGADKRAAFGISPQGNMENDRNMGADVQAWCAVPGYLDYICPQLYYSFQHPVLDYETALEAWAALPRHEGLQLYAGLALYKAGSGADDGAWQLSSDTIGRQIQAARAAECAGVVLYSCQYLEGEQTEEEMKNVVEVLAPSIDLPRP